MLFENNDGYEQNFALPPDSEFLAKRRAAIMQHYRKRQIVRLLSNDAEIVASAIKNLVDQSTPLEEALRLLKAHINNGVYPNEYIQENMDFLRAVYKEMDNGLPD